MIAETFFQRGAHSWYSRCADISPNVRNSAIASCDVWGGSTRGKTSIEQVPPYINHPEIKNLNTWEVRPLSLSLHVLKY